MDKWTSVLAKQSGLQQRTTDCVCRCIFGSTVHHDAPTTVREAHFDGSNYSTGSLRLSPVQYPVGVPSTALNRWPLICLWHPASVVLLTTEQLAYRAVASLSIYSSQQHITVYSGQTIMVTTRCRWKSTSHSMEQASRMIKMGSYQIYKYLQIKKKQMSESSVWIYLLAP